MVLHKIGSYHVFVLLVAMLTVFRLLIHTSHTFIQGRVRNLLLVFMIFRGWFLMFLVTPDLSLSATIKSKILHKHWEYV